MTADVRSLLAALSPLEAASVGFALLYLVLAIRQNVLCWPAAFVSTVLSIALFVRARLYPESALQVFYAAMAVYGWYQWRRGPRGEPDRPVRTWPWAAHLAAIGGTLALAAVLGTLLERTNAAFPYLDSFTSVAAVVTTYMVAKKVLENWVYWLVIDGLTLYIYCARDLYLYAGLFAVYLVLVVVGFFRWHRDWRIQQALAPT